MDKFNVGDKVRVVDTSHSEYVRIRLVHGSVHTVSDIVDGHVRIDGGLFGYRPERFELVSKAKTEENAVQPNVYKFPNAEVRDISAHLTSFGGQAVQYVARATRLDGLVKGKPVQDIEKAIQVLQWELERLQEAN